MQLNFLIPVFYASVDGDSDKIQAVGGQTGAILQPGSKAHSWWMTLRRHIRETATAGREPAQFADTMAIAVGFYHWVSQTKSAYGRDPQDLWDETWASVSDHTRSALVLPRSPSEIVASDAIFSASSYWRNWFDFD